MGPDRERSSATGRGHVLVAERRPTAQTWIDMDDRHELTELQIAIMEILWSRGEATIAEVQDALLPDRELAFTTVATMLSRLRKKGVVDYRTEGRQYVYRARVSRHAVESSMVQGLVEQLFGGDVSALMSRLVGSDDVDPDDLARVKALIEQKQRALEEGHER